MWLSIALRPLVALILFGTAAYLGYLIKRAGARRGWNSALWQYLSKPMHVVPQSEAERRDWWPVFWLLVPVAILFVVVWFTDPVPH